MKVLTIIPYLSPSYGGTSKSARELAENLGKLDSIFVDLITTNANNGRLLTVDTSRWVLEENYRVRYFRTWHRVDLVISLPLIWWFIKNVRNYDLVHTNTIFSPTLSCVHGLCRLFGIPYLMTPRGMLEPWSLSYKTIK
jgi:glycosyltransferase involved in cell wall biosynthesis